MNYTLNETNFSDEHLNLQSQNFEQSHCTLNKVHSFGTQVSKSPSACLFQELWQLFLAQV